MKLRPSDLAAIFEVYLLAVGLGSLKTALDAHGPWYLETASFWVYGMTLLGPTVAAVLFCAVSAAFLPGAAGFLQSNYALNTFMVLTFAYGWGGLAAYAVASVFLLASGT